MAKASIQTGIEIQANVQGSERIRELADTIQATTDETSELAQEAKQLQQQWQQAQSNQAIIEHYRAIKTSLSDNRQEIAQTEQKLRQLHTQMKDGASKQQKHDYQQLEKQLAQLNQQKRNLLNSLRNNNHAMQEAGMSVRNLSAHQKQLTEQSQQAEQQLSQLHKIAQAKTKLGLDIDAKIKQEIAEIQQSFQMLKQSGALSHEEMARAAQLQTDKLYRLNKQLGDLRPTLQDMAQDIQGMVSQAAGLSFMATEAMKFETAMAAVKKVTEGSAEQYEQLSGSLKQLGAELGIMPDQLAQIAAQGGQMGLSLEKLPEFTKMAAQMSVAFGISTEQAGEMAAKISNVFQLPMEDMGRLNDAINTLGNTTAAKEAEISEVLMRIGGNAKQFGLAAEEAAALGAAFISLGKTPEVAGTAINALLTKLQNAKLGNDEFKNSLKDLGLSAEEMAENIAANPQAALDDFLQRLQKLDAQARSEALGKLFGAEYSDDLALLVGSLKTYEDALATATDREKTFGAMKKETEDALNTTAKKLDQAKSNIVNAAIELGKHLLPAIQAAASAVGGMAKTVQSLSEQFPMLSQMGVLFLSAKVAAMALSTAMKWLGVESGQSLLKTKLSVEGVKQSVRETALTTKKWATETALAAASLASSFKSVGNGIDGVQSKSQAIKTLGKNLASAAQNAVALYSAFEVGHSFGTALREQSTLVRDLGDNMGKGVAYFMAMFNDDTWENVRQNYRTTREEIREQAKAQREAAKAAQERAEKEKQANEAQAQKIRELTETYRAQQAQYQGNEQSLRVLTAAGKENGVIADQLREQNKQLEQQLAQTKDKLVALNADIADTSPLAKNRQALSDLGLTAEQVATGISQSAKKSLDDFALAAQGFGNDADAMAQIFQAAVKKMDSPEALAELKKSLTEVGQNAGLSAEQIDRIAQSAPQAGLGLAQISKPLGEAEKAATALGVSLENAFAGSSPAMQTALSHFTTLRGQLQELSAQGLDTGLILQQSLAKLTETAQSQADIDALKQSIQSLGQSGALSMQEVERAILATDVRLQELKGTIDPTEAAFKKLGIQSRESLRLAAEETRLAFETVKNSGQASTTELQKAFENTANSLLTSGDVAQRAWVESQAAAFNYKIVVDETGKAALQAASQTKTAAQQQMAAHKQTADAARQSANAQSQANQHHIQSAQKATEATQKQGKAVSELGQKVDQTLRKTGGYRWLGTGQWLPNLRRIQDMHIDINRTLVQLNRDMENGGNLAASLAKAQAHAIGNAHKLDKATLNHLQAAIDKARQKMQALSDEAATAQLNAEKKLLQVQGKDDELAKLEHQEAIDALRQKQQEAKKMGNNQAVFSYEKAIADTEKAFWEQQKRQEQERFEQELKWRQEQEQQREQAIQKQQQIIDAQVNALEKLPVDVNVNADLSTLIDVFKSKVQAGSQNAVQQLLIELTQSLSQQR
ncbi:MAG: phage tail tape measure protein [Alysiella sp.]|uniref:phage tail tape measure protein n=1 Tax=Alysiella sp. TaxID=1872483 RepID=UPI0026DDA56B|nr:phage tail tape measure protein [Alysiella sp.]MDO4434377.1 phage tail tape measure protein [Alysiella sp.]